MNDEKRRRARELMKLYYGGIVEANSQIMPPELETVSISGTVLNFNTDIIRPLESLILHIDPHQSGSGTPSPSNIRPISGYDTINVYRSGADTSNPAIYPISMSSADAVYGGSLDVTTGELVVDRVTRTISDITGWAVATVSNRVYFYTTIWEAKNVGTIVGDTPYKALTSNVRSMGITTVANAPDGSLWQYESYFRMYDSSCTTAAQYLAKYGDGQICYYLATPITYHLTPTEVITLLGGNNIWMDADGTIDAEYWRIKQ